MNEYPYPADIKTHREFWSGIPDMSNATFGGDRPASENMEADLVAEDHASPGCSERRADWLGWLNDEQVECATCGEVYRP